MLLSEVALSMYVGPPRYDGPETDQSFKDTIDEGVPGDAYHWRLSDFPLLVRWVVKRLNAHDGLETTDWSLVEGFQAIEEGWRRFADATYPIYRRYNIVTSLYLHNTNILQHDEHDI